MRVSPTAIERRIVACLADGLLSYTDLKKATDAHTDQYLSRALKRMRKRGHLVRRVHATTPVTTSYSLPSDDGGVVKS
jgi:DNA-binding HxlR family transcriptional regulator